ncbi:Hypothetical predicted protein, partial [Mytilus galloprovincialis]
MTSSPPAKKACIEMKIGTHNGSFHCDEVLACFLLKQLPTYKDAEIIRGRRNRWPVSSKYTVGPVKLNKERPDGPVNILGPLGPATFIFYHAEDCTYFHVIIEID